MKKTIIKTFSVLLVLVMIAFTFAGCDLVPHGTHIFPDGYTCGFGLQPGSPLEYWWVETYEECLDAIELLKSHGSTFSDDIVLAYDEELFDVKYCFVLVGDGRHGERIKFGDNPFDRWAYDIRIDTYAFFDDVTIDELVYSYAGRYETYRVGFESAYKMLFDDNQLVKDLHMSDWTKISEAEISRYVRKVLSSEQAVMAIITEFFVSDEEMKTIEFKMTDECIDHLINSVKIIELNSEE